MIRQRPVLPAGHGEVLTQPDVAEWAALLDANRVGAAKWDFSVGGLGAQAFRELARGEVLAAAREFSGRLGVSVRPPNAPDGPIVATGHQPELYHPGVWVKNFLLERIAAHSGATAIDVVVDSDGFEAVEIVSPCMLPRAQRCRLPLAAGTPETCFSCTPAPGIADIERFVERSLSVLETLPAPAIARHFRTFAECLRSAEVDAGNLAELVTFARRRYEQPAGTGYLELPVTWMSATHAATRFFAHIALDAERFAAAYNAELAAFRAETNTRSKAQPFPDLLIDGARIELPFWFLFNGTRRQMWASPKPEGGATLYAGDEVVASLQPDPASARMALSAVASVVAPKALTLTMFTRLFACDLFIHGVGGARYDRVTDGVIRRYFGIEPPRFVVASLTMYLPLGAHVVTDEEVAQARERLNRLEHNPDAMLAEVDFDDEAEREKAWELAREKAALVAAIASPDADKKAIGGRIRAVNAELAALLQPLHESLASNATKLEAQRAASDVLTDRGYPFCLWSPEEVADKVR